jgi:hypothetical protein
MQISPRGIFPSAPSYALGKFLFFWQQSLQAFIPQNLQKTLEESLVKAFAVLSLGHWAHVGVRTYLEGAIAFYAKKIVSLSSKVILVVPTR